MKRKLMMFFTLFFLGIGILTAQTQVRGTVVDDAGEPVIGATIQIKGTSQGTVTDMDGSFNFVCSCRRNTGRFLCRIPNAGSTGKRECTCGVIFNTELLDELIVVGYGMQRKRDVTSFISNVSGDAIVNLATASFDSQLVGRAAGVQVIQPSGVLGAPPRFRVRGINSLSGGTQLTDYSQNIIDS